MMKKRLLSLTLALALCLSMLPIPALAAEMRTSVSYLGCDENGKNWEMMTCPSAAVVDPTMTAWDSGWYVVDGEVTISDRVAVNGEVHLILADGCHLNAQEGVSVAQSGSCLTIYAQSTEEASMGQLDATGNGDNAAIGGDGAQNEGVITINGGRVTATATGYGAGIGGGGRGDDKADNTMYGTITINGGIVTAKSGNVTHGAAGIGGGKGNGGGTITINGGRVTATAGNWSFCGAGIGGGSWYGGTDTTITITGGEVTATGGGSSAGIGGGCNSGGGAITISGGSVSATGGSAGIGGGSDHAGNGSFSTGENGSAVIFASSIGNTTGENDWGGVIFQGSEGQVYGDVTLTEDLTVPESATLTVPAGSALTIPEGVTFINEGDVQNNGSVTNNGTVLDYTGWTSTPPSGNGQCINTHPEITVNMSTISATYGDAVTISAAAPLPEGADAAAFPAGGSLLARFSVNGMALGEPVPLTMDGETRVSASMNISGESQWGTGWNVGGNTVSVEFDPITELGLLGGVGTAELEVAARERTISGPEEESVRATAVTLKEAVLTPNVGTVCYGYAETRDGEIRWNQPGSRIIDGLTPETTYYFYVKAELENYYQAVQAGPKAVTTAAAQLSENTLCLNDGDVVITNGESGMLSVTQGSASYSIPADQPIRITGGGEAASNTITVQDAAVTLVLDGIRQGLYEWEDRYAFIVQNSAHVTLVLEGENVMAASGYCNAGISLEENSTLTVKGPGSLTIEGEAGTGIMTNAGSSVTVNGGMLDITARSVAVGSPYLSSGQTASITINGGVVKTNVQYGDGVGIGTRHAMEGGVNIVIAGGSVELSGEGNSISAAGISGSGVGSVTINGGSVSTAGTISPTPTDGENPLVPVTVHTEKTGTAVQDLMLDGMGYGSPAQTDGNGDLTLYLPEGEYTGLAIIGGEVRKIAASAVPSGSSQGTAQDTGIRIETPGDTKPQIQPDGNIMLPEDSQVTKEGSDTVIALPVGGGIQPAEDGGVHVPAGATVQTGDGPVITLPESGDGGKVLPDGGVVGAPVQVGDTLITISTVYPAQGDVTTDKDGNVTLPGGTTANVDKDGDGAPDVTVTVPVGEDSGTVKPSGDIELPGGSTVTIADGGDSTTIALPSTGGTVTPGENGEVTVPGGSKVETGGQSVIIPESGGTVTPSGVIKYTVAFNSQGGTTVPSQTVTADEKAAKPSDPILTGYHFDGWYTEADCATAWDFDTDTVSENITLYAKWTKKPSPAAPSDPDDLEDEPPVWENLFTDVKENDWYYAAVEFASENGLFYGTSDTTFSPNSDMTRGMLATVLYRLEKEPGATAGDLFSDVADGQYYSKAITWAAENEIVAGYGNDRFGPEDPITREQLATILWRYAGSPESAGSLTEFTDAAKTTEYAIPALQWAVERKIVSGKGNGVLDPRGKATRAEVAAMLMRYCEKAR